MPYVLVVDDDGPTRDVLRSALEDEEELGIDVDMAHNGAVALELLNRQNYALVFLDLNMPGMDGQAVLRVMRSRSAAPPPVVVLSGDPNARRVAHDYELPYLPKPFDLYKLLALVKSVLPQTGLEKEYYVC
jgi:DNA-binding response OmpR family regulator